MGLDNDLDLKKLQEKIRLERERVAKLEKEVKETCFVLALAYQNQYLYLVVRVLSLLI